MRANTRVKTLCAALAALSAPTAFAIEPAGTGGFSGEVTPRLTYFDYFKDSGTTNTQMLERYSVQKGSDTRGGVYPDLDINLVGTDGQRETFRLEREGFGRYTHRGLVKANSDRLGFTGYYGSYRSATGGIGFLYSPNQVAGGTDPTYNVPANTASGFAAQFNDDSGNQRLYHIDRATYGLGLVLKPALLGQNTAAALHIDGYQRDGNRFATYVAGGSDVAGGAARVLQRWRGFNQPVDERMNRYTLSLNGAPNGFVLSYEGILEKFDNKVAEYNFNDAAPLMGGFGVASDKTIHFVPDSTLVSNNFRLAKQWGNTALAAGYGYSVLDQDSFSQRQQALGYATGKIATQSAYANVHSNLANGIGIEGFVKYKDRKNNSSFPVTGLINPAAGEQLGVRIDRIEQIRYGLAASFRATSLKSTLTLGWTHEDKDRDLTWPAVSVAAPALNGIAAARSLYRNRTESDEVSLKISARPMVGMTLRIAPYHQWANETGQVTEPQKTAGIKARLSHTVAKDALVSVFYDYQRIKNANNALSGNAAASLIPTGTLNQDIGKTLQMAGLSLSMKPSKWINASASLFWHSDDFNTYFLRSDRRRFESPAAALNILAVDRPNYTVDTYVFMLAGDWQQRDELRWNGSYTLSASKGDTASGAVGSALTATPDSIDGRVNTIVHSVAVGVDYELKRNMKLKASYAYDYYDDKIYSALSGGVNRIMVGVSIGF